MLQQIQEYIAIIAPILSTVLGALSGIIVLLKPFKIHRDTINKLVKENINESKVHRGDVQTYRADVQRLEAQVADMNKKLTYLIEDKKKDKRGK